ncbi:MAG: phosphate acetyltransferase [Hyphomicrobiaceae bacterium]
MILIETLGRQKPRKHEKYERLIAATTGLPPLDTAVAYPCDATSLGATCEAAEARMIRPVLVGPESTMKRVANQQKLDISKFEIVDVRDGAATAAAAAVDLVRRGKAELLMKGSLHSDELLSAVAKRETGLRTARRLSHVFIMDVPTHPETLFITDAVVNIAPDLLAKRDIIQNAIDLFLALDLGTPKIAILSAVETVTPTIPSTVEAAALCKMAERGQITGGVLDGPLAFDNAVSLEAAHIKGIRSEVAGKAQVLVVPNLEAGNMLAKNLTFLSQADAAGVVLGARVPIVLTSRADNLRTRLASCAVAMISAHSQRAKAPVRN